MRKHNINPIVFITRLTSKNYDLAGYVKGKVL